MGKSSRKSKNSSPKLNPPPLKEAYEAVNDAPWNYQLADPSAEHRHHHHHLLQEDTPRNYQLVDPSAEHRHHRRHHHRHHLLQEDTPRSSRRGAAVRGGHNQTALDRRAPPGPRERPSWQAKMVMDKWCFVVVVPIIVGVLWLTNACGERVGQSATFGQWFMTILSIVSFYVAFLIWRLDFFGLL